MGQNAKQDENQFPALLAHTGTAGTATTERVTSTNGALNVDIVAEDTLLLRRIVKLLESNAVVDANMRQRIIATVDVLPTLATVSSLTNMAAMGGVDARYLLMDTARNSYANSIRSKLVFT